MEIEVDSTTKTVDTTTKTVDTTHFRDLGIGALCTQETSQITHQPDLIKDSTPICSTDKGNSMGAGADSTGNGAEIITQAGTTTSETILTSIASNLTIILLFKKER